MMTIEKNRLQLEKFAVDRCISNWHKNRKGKTKFLRLGQFFWDHFKLDRIVDKQQLVAKIFIVGKDGSKSYAHRSLYELDGDDAVLAIKQLFVLN